MIFKGFKEKSNKKYIDKKLKNRVIPQDNARIKKVGVLINKDEAIDVKWFDTLAASLKVTPNNFQLIVFTKEKRSENVSFNNTYNEKNIGWGGTIKHPDLERFINTAFDLLISYYTEESIHLKLITTASNAKFKVGVLQEDERLNDLIIKTDLKDYSTFETELLKYLKILNKL